MDRRTALRLLAAIPPLAVVAACSEGTSGGAIGDSSSSQGVLPDLTGPVRDVHLRITASPATARIAPGVDTDVLRFDAEVLDGDPRTVTPSGSYLGPTCICVKASVSA